MSIAGLSKRRITWFAVGVVGISFWISTFTGVSFLTVLKPFAGMFLIGLVAGYVAYHTPDFNPYRYG